MTTQRTMIAWHSVSIYLCIQVALSWTQSAPFRLQGDGPDSPLDKAVGNVMEPWQGRSGIPARTCPEKLQSNQASQFLVNGESSARGRWMYGRTSAADAARGQTMLSRFEGPACSVQRRCCPPRTSFFWSSVNPATGLKEYDCTRGRDQ